MVPLKRLSSHNDVLLAEGCTHSAVVTIPDYVLPSPHSLGHHLARHDFPLVLSACRGPRRFPIVDLPLHLRYRVLLAPVPQAESPRWRWASALSHVGDRCGIALDRTASLQLRDRRFAVIPTIMRSNRTTWFRGLYLSYTVHFCRSLGRSCPCFGSAHYFPPCFHLARLGTGPIHPTSTHLASRSTVEAAIWKSMVSGSCLRLIPLGLRTKCHAGQSQANIIPSSISCSSS